MVRFPGRSSSPGGKIRLGLPPGRARLLERLTRVVHPEDGAIRSPEWRVTLRSAPLLGFLLFGKWNEKVRIVKWKWLAEAEARRHKMMAGKDVLTETRIEPYIPGANVVPLSSRPATARGRKRG